MTQPAPAAAPTRRGGSPVAERARATRQALLDAAREVFARSGFAEAAIADVVATAGASVGTLYHHFGGKADLYLALFEDYQRRQEERATAAVRRAQEDGETHRVRLFLAGARAYLLGCWEERDLARVFLAGGGPAGFELVARRRYREWTRRNAALLAADEEGFAEALVLVLTSVVAEAGAEVAVSDDEERALRLSDEVLVLMERMAL